jgi:methionyl aminopeptidase
VFYEGFHGDTNKTFLVGKVDPKIKQLVSVTYDALWAGIKAVRPGGHLNDIALAIKEVVQPHKYGIVVDYCGHGIGRNFHEDPQVVHAPQRHPGPKLLPGMVFTIEPMINLGKAATKVLADDWTVVTVDGLPSAQFEHTLVVTEDGFEVLTLLANGQEP